jgi:hypothetical protein
MKSTMRKTIISAALIWFIVPAVSFSGQTAVGLNYPGVSVKYGFSESAAAEARYQTTGDISAAGIRGYYSFFRQPPLKGFAGAQRVPGLLPESLPGESI